MQEFIIETDQLTKSFKQKDSVNRIDLRVPRKGIYGFLGPNGAGKTTTIRMLLGLSRPTSGSIKIFNRSLHRNRIHILEKVGSLVESPSYYAHLTGYNNLKIITTIRKISEKRISEVLELVRLNQEAHRPVKEYSLGMKQRLGIAMALISEPELLILDEPTNGLDPSGIQEIRELIVTLPKKYGMTVLVSSHLLSEIEQIATYVGIINQGNLIFQGTLNQLTAQSQPHVLIHTENSRQAAECLRSQGWEVEADSHYIRTSITAHAQSAAMVETLVRHQYPVYRVAEHKRTLEDIFLELTGKGRSL
ncbi:ABC transporter ATP-binding protein [Paenibacillus massiliensis]|uniref:ABC transporter ATP-binding protein n=1 Tax=Paenibacillus massiliensis TaxID=225917 RepID=UPI000471B412|nr:ABC transporter ATP-binding protein [Paenibacillus massiliensis]